MNTGDPMRTLIHRVVSHPRERPDLASLLLGAVSNGEFDKLTAWYPAQVPPGVAGMYAVFGGSDEGADLSEVLIVPDYAWMSLTAARHMFTSLDVRTGSATPMFPIMTDGGGDGLVVRADGRVLALYPGEYPVSAFETVERMWETWAECFDAGAYGTVGGVVELLDEDEERAICARMNPSCEAWR